MPTTSKELSKSATKFQVPNETEAKNDSVSDSANTALTLRYWDLTNSLSRGAMTSGIFTKLDVFPNLWGTEHSQHLKQNDDRILPQLVLGMEANVSLFGEEQNKIKTILLPDSFDWWGKTGWNNTHILQEEDCPGLQQKCVFSDNPDSDLIFDALIIVRDNAHEKAFSVSPHILKFHFILEPPIISSAKLTGRRDLLASFYRGSDVTTPYGKWVYFDPTVKFKTQEKDYAAGKTKMAAAFISNCRTYNGRLRFIEKLQKFIDVDIYGSCGHLTCPRKNQTECFTMLKRDYRFYLSFENSNLLVKKYSESINDVIPIVLGAHPDDYKAICPENSYIHVEDFQNPEELANYMKQLADNHTAYNSYFRWKDTGQFINTNFFCRVCTMVDVLLSMRRNRDEGLALDYKVCLTVLLDLLEEQEDIVGHRRPGQRRRPRTSTSVGGLACIKWRWINDFHERLPLATKKQHSDEVDRSEVAARMNSLVGQALENVGAQMDDLLEMIDAREQERTDEYPNLYLQLQGRIAEFQKLAADYQLLKQQLSEEDLEQMGPVGPWNQIIVRWNWIIILCPGPNANQHLSRDDDRILAQLVFGMGAKESHFWKIEMKTIFLPDSFQWWGKSSWENPHVLNEEDCPGLQQKCTISQNPDSDLVMDALITVRDTLHSTYFNVSSHILKFYFILEPPFISEATLESSNELLASFYRGSDVNTPYGKWVYYDPSKEISQAIFTSNCGTWNRRMDFIRELQKYVSVDVYGACGKLSCALYKQKECYAMLKKDYHFYLSFENSNCRDYVTEKLFVNAYENDVIPIVLGAHPEDYKAICPEKSYIHVEDFENPEELTNYMKHLVATPDEYNSYFRWKDTGQFINTNFFCRVCAMVHYADIVPPTGRKSKFSWNAESAIANNFCLPSGIWYWNSSFGGESQLDTKYKEL
ncbi:Glycoprotein 3-alpha-L-fucosyltransferase A, partial [Orchesella cincta]